MGYFQMGQGRKPTKSNRKDPRYTEIFEQLRDLEYTVSQARYIASEAVGYLLQHIDWTIEQAIQECFK